MSSETRKSFKDRAKEKLTSSFKLKKSDESQSSREDLNILEGEVHGRENPLAWENLPSQIRDRLDPFTLSNIQGEMLNSSGNGTDGRSTVEFSGPMGPIPASKAENKKRTRHITQPKGTLRHTVKSSDTLNSIAAMYDTTPTELKKLNKLMTTTIFPDQAIYVPDKDYIPSEPSSPVRQSPTELEKERPTSHSAPETPRDKRFGPVEVPMVRQMERPRTKSESSSSRSAPGAAQRVMPRPLSEAEAERMDQECLARFIKVNVKHITDGQGVVSGVLLVTPNAIMFDPNVSDPLVKELGADQYGVIAPMETVISAAMYHDIAAMKLKGVPKDESGVKPQVYHAPTCPMYVETPEEIPEESETEGDGGDTEEFQEKIDSEPAAVEKSEGSLLHRRESARKRRKEEMTRTCSCGALSVEEGEFEVPSLSGAAVPEEVEENLNEGMFQIGDGSVDSSGGPGTQSEGERGVKEAKMDEGEQLVPEGVPAEGTQDGQTGETSPGLLSRTLGSISSFGSTISSSNFTNLVDFSSGLFTRNQDERGRVKDVLDLESTPSAGETPGSPHPPSDSATPSASAPPDVVPSPRLRSPSSPPIVENVVKLDDKPDLFRSLNELIPKPAQHFEDPPLYLCLKIGKPLNKKVPQHGPIESYMKNRPKSEYWFSIPRDKVDSLYAFFVQWSPNIYGGDDIDPLARGFIMVDDDEAEEQPKKTMDIIDDYYKPEMKRLTRQMTKDWEIVNVEEMKRRQLIYDEDKLPLPELSHPSTIMLEDHIRTLSKNLPPRSEGYPWTLVYSSDLHGFSLKTLYRSMQNIDSQILLILRDTRDFKFGALLSCAVKQKDHFYGTGECYLFTFYPEWRRFSWTGANNFFIRGDTDNLEIGAGDGSFGLWLDSDLYHGRTQKCDTFNNDVLTETEDFVLKAIEAWAFV